MFLALFFVGCGRCFFHVSGMGKFRDGTSTAGSATSAAGSWFTEIPDGFYCLLYNKISGNGNNYYRYQCLNHTFYPPIKVPS